MLARTFRRALIPTVILLLAALTATASAAAGRSAGVRGAADPAARPSSAGASIDPLLLRELARDGSADALVTLAEGSVLQSATAQAAGDPRELLRLTVPAYRVAKADLASRLPGMRVLRNYTVLPVLFVRITSQAMLDRLASDPEVVGIGADRRDRTTLTQSLPLIGQPAAAAAGYTGAGVSVAVLDTGTDYTRSAFGTCGAGPGSPGCRVVVAQDFAPDDGMLDDPAASLHGTNVSGVVVGVAPDVSVLALDVFDGLGASASDQVAALNFVIANQATYNIRAINMSLGGANQYFTSPCSDPADPRVAAFASARAAGILPVVAAGNNAFSAGSFHVGVSRPACIPGALPVGAVYDSNVGGKTWGSSPNQCTDSTTAADQITCFSQAWTNPMVLAPGALITAAGITLAGTSQATPHIAGAVAVLHDAAGIVSERPAAATVDQIFSALVNSGPLIFDPLIGLNVHRLFLPDAIAALGVTPPPPPPPPVGPPTITSFTPGTGKVLTPVVLIGTNFDGATAVTFNGIAALFAVNLATQITVTVPPGASTGPIAVTTANGTGASLTNFVVQHARFVSLHFSKASGNVSVLDGFADCAANAPIKLQVFRNGKWKSVISGVTKPNGAYTFGQVTDGKYRTIAKKFTTASGDVCLKDVSSAATA